MDGAVFGRILASMRPADLQTIGNELAIKWEDGTETFILLERLRRACPCAGCKGETDIMGNLYIGPEKKLAPESFQLVRWAHVGGYAIQPQWADSHSTGLYTYEYLRQLATSG
jgi:DUF971 family protein